MPISLPNIKPPADSPRSIQAPEPSPAAKAATLLSKHQVTISRLRDKLGFQKDETVIAWLLEQIELSDDINRSILSILSS